MKMHDDQLSVGTIESTDSSAQHREFKFRKGSQKMIFSMFTKSTYSNPIGSIIREITSNCFDAHIEAGVTDPVRIKFTEENQQQYISFIDVGVGMSEDRFYNVYSEYFNTTKEEDPDQIGGFGIGGKTPLAYGDSFYMIANHNGVKNIWCIYKGEESPENVPMLNEPTTERNGTIVKLPIKAQHFNKFTYEMLRQLYYFENIIFEDLPVSNDYTIYHGNHFVYRGNEYSSRMHICLGRVAYPIDYSALELDEDDYLVPIALKFKIGEIDVTQSREAIHYSPETITRIKKKLEAAKAELKEMLHAQYRNISSLSEYYQVKAEYGNLIIDPKNNVVIKLGKRIAKPEELIYPKFPEIRLPDAETLTKLFLKIDVVGRKSVTKKEAEEARKKKVDVEETIWKGSLLNASEFNSIYFIETGEKKVRRTQSWLKSIHPLRYFFISPNKFLTKENFQMVKDALETDDAQGNLVRKMNGEAYEAIIKLKTVLLSAKKSSVEFYNQVEALREEVIAETQKCTTVYSEINVPAEFVIFRRNEFSAAMLDRKINVTHVKGGWGNKKKETTFKELLDFRGIIIYGDIGENDEVAAAFKAMKQLDLVKNKEIYNLLGSDSSVHAVLFNKTTIALIKHVTNAVHYSEVYSRFLIKKRDRAIQICQSRAFINRYNNLNRLFFNKALTSLDKKLKMHTSVLSKIARTAEDFSSKDIYSLDLALLKIDTKKIVSGYNKHFEYIESQQQKNTMVKYVSIPSYEDVTRNAELMQLIDLVYVK